MTDDAPYFAGQLLVAMPGMADPRFDRSVIYMCAHSDEGALGLVVNQLVDSIDFPELLEQLNIDCGDPVRQIRVHFGGPVETGRGFVLHSADYTQDSTLQVNEQVGLTASVGILEAIAQGDPAPRLGLLGSTSRFYPATPATPDVRRFSPAGASPAWRATDRSRRWRTACGPATRR